MATPRRDLQRDKQFVYATPRIEDVLIIEPRSPVVEKDVAYGEAHPESQKYPNHVLVYIEEQRQPDGSTRALWYYAAPRENQDLYNYEVTYPYAGLTACPRIQRTYVEPRATYTPVALGTLDPLSTSRLAEHAVFAGAKLILEQQERISKEFDSRFVAVTRVYEKVPSEAEQSTYNAAISYPFLGITACPRYTRTVVLPLAGYAPLALGTPDTQYPDATLVEQEVLKADADREGRYVVVARVYEHIPSEAEQMAIEPAVTYPFAALTTCPRYTRQLVLAKGTAALALGTADTLHADALLALQKSEPAQGREQSYDIVTRVYERIPSVAEQSVYNAEVSYPYQGRTANPRYTRKYVMLISEYAALPPGTADPQNNNAKLADQQTAPFGDALADSRYLMAIRVYDVFPTEPLITEEVELPISIPERFLASMNRRTEMLPMLSDTVSTLNLTAGDIRTGYVAVTQKMGIEEGARKAKHTVYLQVGAGILIGSEIDQRTGKLVTVTQEIVPAGTLGAEVDSDGMVSEVSPIDQTYSLKTTRPVSSLADSGESRTWYDHVHYAWPPYLKPSPVTGEYLRNWFNGSTFKYEAIYEPGYAGPCLALITETWLLEAPALEAPVVMRPESFEVDLITTHFTIRESLHPAIYVYEYKEGSGSAYGQTEATNYTTWPDYVEVINVDPFPGGGYLKRVTRIFKPSA